MKRVFFPPTLIDPTLAEALAASLGPVTLFHPLPDAVSDQTERLAQAQQVELVFPCPGDSDTLGMAVQAFKRWASEHKGQDLAGLMRAGQEVPFFDTDATARIAAEVKSGGTATVEDSAAERLHRARLLLIMAQELDSSRRELAADFQRLERQERRMLEILKGEDETDAGFGESGAWATPAIAPPLHMLTARMAAWAQLALQAGNFWEANSGVCFLTDSGDVLAQIVEQTGAENLLDRQFVPPGSEALRTWLANPQDQPPLTDATPPTSTLPPVFLTLVRLPALTPRQWLRKLAGLSSSDSSVPDRIADADGVLVGHVSLA